MSEMQEGIQMAMMTGQAMAFVVDKGVILTRQILEALAKLIKMIYTQRKKNRNPAKSKRNLWEDYI